ncbi:predicted protein [Streptomyces sp. AA4]|nr:predicted protein [Streptomyces sp. AA4]
MHCRDGSQKLDKSVAGKRKQETVPYPQVGLVKQPFGCQRLLSAPPTLRPDRPRAVPHASGQTWKGPALNQIFLNYRTVDERFGVALLDHELSRAFGPEAVFFASKSIELGSEWEQYLFDAVKASQALLVVIGRNWLNAADEDGNRLLDDPRDFVRREITTAFELGKRVIPVLLDTPRIPREELPAPLRQLADVQDARVHFRNAVPDIDRLATRLEQLVPELHRTASTGTATAAKFTAHAHQGGVVNQYDRVDVRGDFHAGPR